MNGMGIMTLLTRKRTLGMVSLLGLSASLTLSQFIQSASLAQSTNSSSLSKSSVRLTGRVNLNKYSGAESGVQLLDNIFNRVSNIPQVASIQNQVFNQTQQRLQNKDSLGGKDSIDYKLAIRPKETGKPFANITPSLQISADKNPLLAYDQGMQSSNRFQQSLAAASSNPPIQGGPAGLDDFDSTAAKLSKKTTEVWKGNSKMVHAASAGEDGSSADELRPGVWDREAGTAAGVANEVNAYNSLAMAQARRQRSEMQPMQKQEALAYGNARGLSLPQKRSASSQAYIPGSNGGASGGAGGASQTGMYLPPANMGKYVKSPNDGYPARSAQMGQVANRLKQQGVNVYSATEAQSRMPELANSLNKFYNLNRGLEEAQQYGERLAQASPSAAPSPVPMTISTAAKKKSTFYAAPREIQVIDERPAVRDLRQAPSAPPPQLAYADAAPSASYDRPAPQQASSKPSQSSPVSGSLLRKLDSSESKRAGEKAKVKEEVASKELNFKESEKDAYSDKRRDLLALLPPNVATGIPLVSLGTSQVQAMNALSAIGQVKEQKIGKWNVLTWKKKDSNYTALQLFFRHGLLDAMRIFDQSLVAPDFGAAPGANLEAVKARFGEPAFLLPEPVPGIGQNYVYPISQVGFQFARPEKDSAPQVVSVLIFSVK